MDLKEEPISLVQECTNVYSVKDFNETEVEINIRIPQRFKSLWLVKLSELQTSQQEIDEYED